MNKTVGIGFIGTGFARKVQMPCFAECQNARIVSAASGRLANAKAAADEFNFSHYTDNWRETVDHAEVDLVCITTPPNLHLEQTLYALERGKHVLCEKPMAMSVAEAETMTAKAAEKNVLALIDHELRFQNGRLKAFEMLRSGAIGKIRHAKYNFRAPQRGDANLPWNWWSDKAAGGGALGAVGSHIIDSFNWFLGAEISRVFCQMHTNIKNRRDANGETREVSTDDEANLLIRFTDGELTEDATGAISISMVEQPKYQNYLEFFGTNGAMRIEYLGEIFAAKNGDTDWTQIETETGKAPHGVFDSGFPSGFMAFAPKIIEALMNGKTEIEHAATFADGIKVQKVLDAAHESNDSGRAIEI